MHPRLDYLLCIPCEGLLPVGPMTARPVLTLLCTMQSDAGRQALRRQVLTKEEALTAALRWREDCLRYQVERAGAWMQQPPHVQLQSSSSATSSSSAAPMEALPPATVNELGKEAVAAEPLAVASGHVEVCGVALPKRAAGSMGSSLTTRSALVRTPGMEAALEAAALVLCQDRPLLLEGPPGARMHLCLLSKYEE